MAPFLLVLLGLADKSENGRQLLGQRHTLFHRLARQRKAK
jgi:hypothetical protein